MSENATGSKIFVQDVTLRDGMHAVRHRITPENVGKIVRALDAAGVDAIEVAHGDGLAGGSLNYGPGSNTDWEWIETAAANITNARLTTLLLPGVGTIEELQHAYDLGVRSVRVATHCTEADVSAQHIAKAREIGMDVSGFLMMSHMAEPAKLAEQAKLMESYGAHCVYVTDSGGRLTMDGVADRVRAYRDVLDAGTVPTDYLVADGMTLDDLLATTKVLAESEVVGLEVGELESAPDSHTPPTYVTALLRALDPLLPARHPA